MYLCIMQTSSDQKYICFQNIILWKIAFPKNVLDCRKYWKSSTYALCKLQVTEIFYEKLHSQKIFWTAENIENPVLMHYANFNWQKYFMKNCIPRKFSGLQKILKIQYSTYALCKLQVTEIFYEKLHFQKIFWTAENIENPDTVLEKKKFKKKLLLFFFFFFIEMQEKMFLVRGPCINLWDFEWSTRNFYRTCLHCINQWDFHLNARKNVSRKWTLYKPMGFWMKYEKLLSHLPALYKPMGFSSVQASAIKVSRTSFKIP